MAGRLDGSGWRHRAFSWPAGAMDIPLGCRRRRDHRRPSRRRTRGGRPSRTTRALTIDAPVEMVWPWLAQIGEDRGGFYSYSWLEKAAGADIHNAKTVHSEWQNIRVGDTVWLARRYGERARQVVAAVKPKSHLVLMSPDDFRRVQRGEKASGAWTFCLRRQIGWTRLIVRGSGGAVGHSLFDILTSSWSRK